LRDTTQINTPTRAGTFMVKAIDKPRAGERRIDERDPDRPDHRPRRSRRDDRAARLGGRRGRDWHDGELKLPPPSEPEIVPPGVFLGERGTVINAVPTRVDVYSFANRLDLGIVCQVSMVALVQARGRYLGRVMRTWVPLASQVPLATGTPYTMSTWVPLAMAIPLQMGLSPNWDAHIEARVSQNGETFDEWFPLKSTLITARAFEWRLVGAIYDLATTLFLLRAEVWCEVPTRAERGDDVVLDGMGITNMPNDAEMAELKAAAKLLEKIRDRLGGKLISSGFHRSAVNQAVGGATASAHLTGHAADFTCPGYGDPLQIGEALDRTGAGHRQLIHE
jgi:hypothetical protein